MAEDQKQELAVRPPAQLSRVSPFRFIPTSLGEAQEMALIIAKSDLCPKAYRDRPADILIAWEHGSALGFSWLQSLCNIASINGRPGIFGDAIPALVMATGECTRFHSPMPEDGEPAVCIIGRKGYPDEWKVTFSEKDAKTARLWGKQGPWTEHPRRMLQMRARAFCVRDAFPDKLMGLGIVEELQDYPSIEAQVVHSEVVSDPLEKVSEGLRDSLGKGFETLAMSPAQRLVKINEHFLSDRTPDESAQSLLDWMKDEWAKRKSGRPRQKKEAVDNGKKTQRAAPGDASHDTSGSIVPDPPADVAAPAVEPAAIAEAEPVAKTEAEFLFKEEIMATDLLPILRRSAIQSARSCLYRYKAIWVDGTPDDNEHSLRGIGFHAAAYHYVQALWEAKLPADEDLSKQAFVAGMASSQTPAPLIPEVRAIYTRWAENFQLDLDAFLGAEEKAQDTEYTFTVDVVYARPHELEIVDFKTFFQPLTEQQVRDDWQARWYIFAARKVWPGFKAYRFTHSYVRLGLTTSVVFEERDLDGFADEVAAIAGVIDEAKRTNHWPATPGDECRFCQLECPVVDNQALIPKRLLDPVSARKAAELIMAGEQLIKAAKAALKGWCGVNGPVDVQGVQWDNRAVMQRAYPVAEVLKVLQDRGRMGAFESEDLTLSASALGKLFKAYPQLETDLAPYLREKRTYRFGARRPGVGDEDE